MTLRKRNASSTAHLIGTELSDDGLNYSSPLIKRSRRKKSNKPGDGWLFRPSAPRIPSPNTSPLPIRWKKLSSPRLVSKTTKMMEVEYPPGQDPSPTGKSGSYVTTTDDEDGDGDSSMTMAGNMEPTVSSNPDKGLATVTKRLQALDQKLSASPQVYQQELASLRGNIRNLEERAQRNEIRAAIRHDIIFDALKKISEDVNQIRSNSNRMATFDLTLKSDEEEEQGAFTSAERKKKGIRGSSGSGGGAKKDSVLAHGGGGVSKNVRSPVQQKHQVAARKTMERCLDQYMEKMNNATTVAEVKKTGELCKQYADNLIKTYI